MLYGESPHIASMTLVPLAALAWDIALDRRKPAYAMLAAIATAATVLTSWLGGFALALMIVALLVSRGLSRREIALTAAIAAGAYCLAMPWAPPSTIAATQFNSKTLGGDFRWTYLVFPNWILFAAFVMTCLRLLLRRLDRGIQFAVYFLFLIGSVVVSGQAFGIFVVPQPVRYHLESEMALALALALVLKNSRIAVAAMCLLLIYPAIESHRYSRRELMRPIDITTTPEWKIAQWLNREWTGERVMMSGSVAFWLTTFSDVPELNGGTEQGAVDFMARVAAYGIYFGGNGEAAVLWLKALGVQAVGVSDAGSGEYYKAYRNPKQFDGLLEPIYRANGDTIYRAGVAHASLARIVAKAALPVKTPENGLDIDPLRPYVAALDDPASPRADFHWTTLHSARIRAELKPDQALSIQIPWHKGWRTSNGTPLHRDALGLMYLNPPGRVDLEMIYDGGLEMKMARALFALALAAGIFMSVYKR